jgi:hypothetical protein
MSNKSISGGLRTPTALLLITLIVVFVFASDTLSQSLSETGTVQTEGAPEMDAIQVNVLIQDGWHQADREELAEARLAMGYHPPSPADYASPPVSDAALPFYRKLIDGTLQENVPVALVLSRPDDATQELENLRTLRDQSALKLQIAKIMEVQAPSKAAVLSAIGTSSTEEVRYSWLAHALYATLHPDVIDEISKRPEVIRVSRRIGHAENFNYSGDQLKQALLANEFVSAGFDGDEGNRLNGETAVRVATIEWSLPSPNVNFPHRHHVGWLDSPAPSRTRMRRIALCESNGCHNQSGTVIADGHYTQWHASWVTWTIGGSIEQGQDASYSGSMTSSQRRRSGVAKEADVYALLPVFTNNDDADAERMVIALEAAMADGVDIVVIPSGFRAPDEEGHCTPNENFGDPDFGGLNAAISAAFTAGTLIVAAAGNSGTFYGNSCAIAYPAIRPEVLTVGALNTTNGLPVDQQSIAAYSSRGGIPTTVYLYGASTTSGIDLLAPGGIFDFHFNHPLTAGPQAYSDIGNFALQGTSFAAPAIAGSGALMKDALHNLGFHNSKNVPGRLKAVISVMGDKYLSGSTGTDFRSGYGRFRGHFPGIGSMGTVSGWALGDVTLSEGQIAYIPIDDGHEMSSLVKGVKAAMNWAESDYSLISDVVFSIQDTCVGGGSGIQTLAQDYTFNMTKAIKLTTGITNSCLRLRIASNASLGSRKIYWAYFFYSDTSTTEY